MRRALKADRSLSTSQDIAIAPTAAVVLWRSIIKSTSVRTSEKSPPTCDPWPSLSCSAVTYSTPSYLDFGPSCECISSTRCYSDDEAPSCFTAPCRGSKVHALFKSTAANRWLRSTASGFPKSGALQSGALQSMHFIWTLIPMLHQLHSHTFIAVRATDDCNATYNPLTEE